MCFLLSLFCSSVEIYSYKPPYIQKDCEAMQTLINAHHQHAVTMKSFIHMNTLVRFAVCSSVAVHALQTTADRSIKVHVSIQFMEYCTTWLVFPEPFS